MVFAVAAVTSVVRTATCSCTQTCGLKAANYHCRSQAWNRASLQGSESSATWAFMQALMRPCPGGTSPQKRRISGLHALAASIAPGRIWASAADAESNKMAPMIRTCFCIVYDLARSSPLFGGRATAKQTAASSKAWQRLTFLDAGRDVSVVLDSSLRTIDAEHYVERPRRYRQPVGHWHTRRQLPSHVNRHRAVLRVRGLQPWRVVGDRVFVSRVIDQFYRLRGICGDGPEAICLGELPLRKGQDIAPRVAPVERVAVDILEY